MSTRRFKTLDEKSVKNKSWKIIRSLVIVFVIGFALIKFIDISTDPNRQSKRPSSRTVSQKKRTRVEAPKKFYLRIAFFNDTDKKPISPNCRMWIRGFGDFYPTRQGDWKFGGTLIEKAGPFDINKEHTIYFYPDYSDESKEIKIPFKYSAGMNPKGSVKDMLTISIKPKTIVFEGVPLKNATDEFEYKFNRKTCKKVY